MLTQACSHLTNCVPRGSIPSFKHIRTLHTHAWCDAETLILLASRITNLKVDFSVLSSRHTYMVHDVRLPCRNVLTQGQRLPSEVHSR